MTASGARCQADGGVAHACVCTSSAAVECEIPKQCARICAPSGCAPAFEARSATTCGDGAPNSREDGPSWRDGGGGGARGCMSRKPRGDMAAPATMARPRRGASEPISDPAEDGGAEGGGAPSGAASMKASRSAAEMEISDPPMRGSAPPRVDPQLGCAGRGRESRGSWHQTSSERRASPK